MGTLALRLAVATAVAGALVWWAGSRAVGAGTVAGILLAGLLAAAPVVLGLFALACRALAALPARLREVPAATRERARAVRARASEVAEARHRGGLRQVAAVGRLGLAVARSREVLELSPALALLSPWMVGATVFALFASVVQLLAGVAVLVSLLVG